MSRPLAVLAAGILALACDVVRSGTSSSSTGDCECAGPHPGAPNYLCADGTPGGPGPCIRGADGRCGWAWRTCDRVTECSGCSLSGIAPTSCQLPYLGSSGPSGICAVQPDGSCAELMLSCYLP